MSDKKLQLSYKEKLKLLMAEDYWSNYGAEGKVYKFVVSDGPVGVRHPINLAEDGENGCHPSVSYPSSQVLSQTWEPELARLMGNCIAYDCIDLDIDMILAPGINIKRTPLAGRNFEYFSEDPYLAGIFGREYIYGVQEKHVGATLKHYCANNIEYSRHWISSEVDERTLREIYIRPFEIALQAQPYALMCSYNLVNGIRMSENKKLFNLLRDEFNYDGIIITDWDACKNVYNSLMAGVNMIFPYRKSLDDELDEIIDKKLIDEQTVDKLSERVVNLAEKCRKDKSLRKAELTVRQRSEVGLKIAEEGIVLLKNDGVLPFNADTKVFMTGSPCHNYYAGEGSSKVVLRENYEFLETVYASLGGTAEYHESIYVYLNRLCANGVKDCIYKATLADVAVIAVGNEPTVEGEFYDRQSMKLSNEEVRLICDIANVAKKTVVVIYAGAPVDMSGWINKVSAVIYAGFCGENSSYAVSKVLLGQVNPSGKLTETFPIDANDVPAVRNYMDSAAIVYEERLNVGYRYFESFNVPVQFPFGYGLSYSDFEYSNLNVEVRDGKIDIAFDITNTSEVDGKETAQVYIGEITKDVYRPKKELKGFKKVFVGAHSTQRVNLTLEIEDLAYYSVGCDRWVTKDGCYEIMIGKNARDIVLNGRILVNGSKQ